MLPISLTFQGIYSYQNRVTIDFKSLTSAGMFGIFGAVGSGKSTILDAISLALYDKIERLTNPELKNIINLRSSEIYIEFDFLAGKENRQYRFTYSRKFDKKRVDIRPTERRQYILNEETNEWKPIKIEAKELLNISYDNFKRTIILPQGKFQDFLHLGGTDRTNMMIQLFNLENYDLENKLKPIKEANNVEFSLADAELKNLENVTKENLDLLIKELEILHEKQESIKENLHSLQKTKENFDNLEKLDKQIKTIQKELELLENQQENISAKENILKQYKLCKELFANLFENNEKIKQNITHTQKEKENQDKQLQDIDVKVQNATENLAKVQKEVSLKPEIQEKLDDLIRIKDIAIAQKILDSILPTSEKESKKFEEVKEKLDISIQKNQQIKDEIAHKEKEKPQNMAVLYEIQRWFDNKLTLAGDVQNIKKEIESQENKLKFNLNNQKIEVKSPLNVEQILAFLEDKINQEELKKEETETNLRNLNVKQELQKYAEKLVEGEPCPVCGSAHHPDISFGKELVEDIKIAKKMIEEHKKSIKDLQEIKAEFQASVKNIEKYNKNYATKLQELNDFDDKFIWRKKGYDSDDRKEIDKQIIAHKLIEEFVIEKRREQKEVEKETEILSTKKEELDKSLQDLAIQKATKTSEIDTKVADLKHLKNYKEHLNHDFDTKIKAGKDKIEKIDKDFKDAQNTLLQYNNEKIKWQSNVENTFKNIEKYQQELQKNENEILEKMQKSNFNAQTEIQKILKNQIDIQKTEKEITTFYENISAKKGSLETIKTQMQNQSYDIDKHKEVKFAFQNIQNELEQIKKDSNLIEANIQKIQKDLAIKITISRQFEKIKQRKEDIETMQSLFYAKGFAKYVSNSYLENLCLVANKRFRIFTRQQLTLELEGREDNKEFYVCDFLHEGRKRSVKTLSGGQTFQASLALALALAETVSAFQYSHQNFFFMDEGFGSLDDDSLSTVFQTLQTLREENRIVGIISHVERLKEEIPTFLKVEINENGGSSVKMMHN